MEQLANFSIVTGTRLAEVFNSKYRIYLCGGAQIKQEDIACILDDKLEIGSSCYREFSADTPHFHTHATEYVFIVQGAMKVWLINEHREYVLEKGSLFVLQPNTPYASKNATETQTLFVKCPGGNDKKEVPVDEWLARWLSAWDAPVIL